MMRLYRNQQALWIKRIGIVKGIGSASTIAGWVIWKDYAIVWAVFLGLIQILDAIKDYTPQLKNQQAANDLLILADQMYIDARHEWHKIYSGQLTEDEIMERWKALAKRRQEAEAKCFPLGLVYSKSHLDLANQEVTAYLARETGAGA